MSRAASIYCWLYSAESHSRLTFPCNRIILGFQGANAPNRGCRGGGPPLPSAAQATSAIWKQEPGFERARGAAPASYGTQAALGCAVADVYLERKSLTEHRRIRV